MKVSEENSLLNELFPDLDYDELHFSKADYFPILVSVYDHILTPEECDELEYMTYTDAKNVGALPDYMRGERHFIDLYRQLAEDGVYARMGENVDFLRADSTVFRRILLTSLREEKPLEGGFMDVYFPSLQIRVLGSYDRTDVFLLRDKSVLPKLEEVVRNAGLFILPADHLM